MNKRLASTFCKNCRATNSSRVSYKSGGMSYSLHSASTISQSEWKQSGSGTLIDNETPIDYEQLYAQLVDEVETRQLRWWFTAGETQAIQEANLTYQHVYSLAEMVGVCFRRPRFGEKAEPMTIAQIMEAMQQQYPEMDTTPKMKAMVGAAMKRLGFEQRRRSEGNCYIAVPRQVA